MEPILLQMLNNSNDDDTQKQFGLTKKQFNLHRHLNSDNMKSILSYNDDNTFVNYIECSICNCPHQLIKVDTTNNNLMSSKLEENHAYHHRQQQQQQQEGAYCNNMNSMKPVCSCCITWLHRMEPSYSSNCQVQNINCQRNCCHSLHSKLKFVYPLCNCYNEEIQQHKCRNCSCQQCIQTKLISTVNSMYKNCSCHNQSN
uniref:SJCHGC09393 protein n=1 Tax=Schistosoma japonicum TaxID=6182 RepID=Q5DA31_SCHJA|nr:SJCHGC09393 protein [Schistosoma japonicum]